jgi:hypothetical protein
VGQPGERGQYPNDCARPAAIFCSVIGEACSNVTLHEWPLSTLLVLQELDSHQATGEDTHSAGLASSVHHHLLLSMLFSDIRVRHIPWPALICIGRSFGRRLDHYKPFVETSGSILGGLGGCISFHIAGAGAFKPHQCKNSSKS